MKKSINHFLILILIFTFILGCASKRLKNYEEFKDFSKPNSENLRIPVIIVPGVKGSLLKRGEKEFWGKSYRVALIHTFDELQFPIESQLDENFHELFGHFYRNKNVRNGGVMEKYGISLAFMKVADVSIYGNLKDVLEKSGGYSSTNDLFTFSYDWRLDNRVSAAHLAFKVEEYQERYHKYLKKKFIINGDDKKYKSILREFQKRKLTTKEGRIKVNLVAHSMGGLVARYYIQMLGGEDCVNKLVMLGTPNQGAMDALKAISEGEFPESIFHFYFKKRTRPIIFSWPSTFQLLPRYSRCIYDTSNQNNACLDDFGLSSSYSAMDDYKVSDIVVKNWEEYNLIPDQKRFDNGEDEQKLKKYLKEQLISATKFYSAINGKYDRKYEEKKLQGIHNFCNIASIDVSVKTKFIDGNADIPFILFGGHCEPTLKYAKIKQKDNIKYLEFDKKWEDKDDGKAYTIGDGRVPVVSLRLPYREISGDFQFLLCEDHTGMISSKTFQYNLLRELLWQSSFVK
jgi:hypothetical protein